MGITDAFAGIAVTDHGSAAAWYERLLGRPPDMRPHEKESSWRLAENGWLYVVEDPDRAGRGLLTLLVDDLDAELARVSARGIEASSTETIPGKVRKAELEDPDGNRVTLGQPLSQDGN